MKRKRKGGRVMHKILIFIGGFVLGGYVVYNEMYKSIAKTVMDNSKSENSDANEDTEVH